MTSIKPFKNQNYNLIDEEHSSTRLFVDPEFPACLKSISHSGKLDLITDDGGDTLQHIEWRRPHVRKLLFLSISYLYICLNIYLFGRR